MTEFLDDLKKARARQRQLSVQKGCACTRKKTEASGVEAVLILSGTGITYGCACVLHFMKKIFQLLFFKEVIAYHE